MNPKKTLIPITLVICCIVTLFIALIPVKAQNNISVYIQPTDIYANFCENFDVYIMIDNPQGVEIGDYDIFLYYDNTQMTPVNAQEGDYLEPPTVFSWEVLGGSVHVWSVTLDGAATFPTGTLTIVTFHCDDVGDSDLWMDVVLSDMVGAPIYPDYIYGGHVHQQTVTNTYIDPPVVTVPICEPFTVDVMVDQVTDLYSFDLQLSYNTTYVDAIDITDGGFLIPPTLEIVKIIDDAAGIIQYSLTSTAPTGADGSGSIATVTFHCTGAGESLLNFDWINLYNSAGIKIPTNVAGGRVIQFAYWEPVKLQHLVELPYSFAYVDLPFVPPSSPEGYAEVRAALEAKGYIFDPAVGGSLYHIDSFFDVYFEPGSEPFEGTVASWWSSNMLEDGTKACLLSAEWEDNTSIAMGFVTNLLPPEQMPGVDPYIIWNAEPYFFIEFYWWAWHPIARIIRWPYWWHNSHNHPNWFWGPYWWWRTYTKAYYLGMPWPPTDINWAYWRPWWGWWWHWVYWRHWYWWSSYFPYDP